MQHVSTINHETSLELESNPVVVAVAVPVPVPVRPGLHLRSRLVGVEVRARKMCDAGCVEQESWDGSNETVKGSWASIISIISSRRRRR
jgi:hypothetical protein